MAPYDVESTVCQAVKRGPCKLTFPFFSEYAEKYPNAVLAKFNADDNDDLQALATEWKVMEVGPDAASSDGCIHPCTLAPSSFLT